MKGFGCEARELTSGKSTRKPTLVERGLSFMDVPQMFAVCLQIAACGAILFGSYFPGFHPGTGTAVSGATILALSVALTGAVRSCALIINRRAAALQDAANEIQTAKQSLERGRVLSEKIQAYIERLERAKSLP